MGKRRNRLLQQLAGDSSHALGHHDHTLAPDVEHGIQGPGVFGNVFQLRRVACLTRSRSTPDHCDAHPELRMRCRLKHFSGPLIEAFSLCGSWCSWMHSDSLKQLPNFFDLVAFGFFARVRPMAAPLLILDGDFNA